MKFRIIVGAAAGFAMCATVAAAQVCQGDLPFRGSSNHVGGSIGKSDNATSFGGGLTHGHQQGWYTGASVGMMTYDQVSGNSVIVNGGLGYSMPLQTRSKWQLCPGATLSLGFGPSIDTGVGTLHTASQTVTMGASVGTSVPMTKSVNILPFGSASLGYTRVSGKINGTSSSATDTYLLIGAGAGFQISPRVVLRPAVALAAGADLIDDTAFSFGVTFALPH